jgi:hypothetical protein
MLRADYRLEGQTKCGAVWKRTTRKEADREQMPRSRHRKILHTGARWKLVELQIQPGQMKHGPPMPAAQTKRASQASCHSNLDRADFAMSKASNRSTSSPAPASSPRRSRLNTPRARRPVPREKWPSSSASKFKVAVEVARVKPNPVIILSKARDGHARRLSPQLRSGGLRPGAFSLGGRTFRSRHRLHSSTRL